MRLTLAFLFLAAAAACHTAPRPAPTPWDGVARATVDTLGARLAALEVERLSLVAVLRDDAPELVRVGRQLDALRGHLAELSDAPAVRRLTRARILAALEARQAALAVERRQLLAAFTPESRQVRQVETLEHLVAARRAALAAEREAEGDASRAGGG